MPVFRLIAAAALVLALAGCASLGGGGSGPGAPQPLKSIDAGRFYTGRWLEVARLPMDITDGCVAGATAYALRADGKVDVHDTCQVGAPQGPERAIAGVGTFVDPGTNAKLRVRYLWLIVWEYWVLDRAEDYSWFISSDPSFDKLFIYTREVPTRAELDALVRRAAALGYDTSRLEFPEPLPN
ncbi:MAG: lipocalin family protein [Brevundimonas sp.]